MPQSRFFEEALALNPQDDLAKYLLIENYASSLNFAVHEVPRGVLGEKIWMDEMLAKLEQLIKETGLIEKYRESLAYWHFHADAWDDYLKTRGDYTNYRDYLAKHPYK